MLIRWRARPGRSLRKLGDPTFFSATREGAISDTVAREGGSSTHRTQCPHFHATGDYIHVYRRARAAEPLAL